MSSLNSQQKKLQGQSRKEAIKAVAKRELLNFRIDRQSIQRIYDMAATKEKHVGTMIREWVLEKLQAEEEKEAQKVEKQVNMPVLGSKWAVEMKDQLKRVQEAEAAIYQLVEEATRTKPATKK